MCTLTGVLTGVSNRPVKKCCACFGHIYIFMQYNHVRWLNILNFGHWFNFCDKKFNHFDCCVILERYFGHVLTVILYLARSRAGQCAHYSKWFNEVYKAYIINHISYKKFSDKPNRVKKTNPLGGLTLIWKLRPDRVKWDFMIETYMDVPIGSHILESSPRAGSNLSKRLTNFISKCSARLR